MKRKNIGQQIGGIKSQNKAQNKRISDIEMLLTAVIFGLMVYVIFLTVGIML